MSAGRFKSMTLGRAFHNNPDLGKGKGKAQSSETNFTGKCNYCGITGHRERDCRKKKKDESSGSVRAVDGQEGEVRIVYEEEDLDSYEKEFFCMACGVSDVAEQ